MSKAVKFKRPEINLIELIEKYRDEDECRIFLEELRWPDGVKCPRCNHKSISRVKKRGQFDCNSCRYQFSVTAGTIFHDSHLPLSKWFITIYLMLESKKGVSANQIKRTIGVSYKTAWYLCHRIRAAMTEIGPPKLSGKVEVDETWVGGKKRGRGKGYKGNKSIVVGVVQRGGKTRLQVVHGLDRKTLHDFIKKHTDPETDTIYTDDWPSYKGIGDYDTQHKTVTHRKGEYVVEDAHTNTIENVWSLLKRSITGTYHKLSAKHLDAYLDELEWRFNNRDNPYLFRDTLRKLISADKLEFSKLIS
ncbi:IS1595 family transposase [Nitrospinae bacterium AH_259_B05_G02_I21]|nr:IS1595 family transposase [Nitrospinae bacterium AH_259_B05_G02_I21]